MSPRGTAAVASPRTQAHAEHRYWARNADFETEHARLRLLERHYDPITIRRLGTLRVGEGHRCLEVGAGAGSVTRWLAGRVGAVGRVVAADIDPRFLEQLDLPNVDVRRFDILSDAVEEGAYDLVHCRALLLHLPDPRRALERMVSALRPEAWLLVEDADYGTFSAADPEHPLSAAWNQAAQSFLRFAGLHLPFDLRLGRRLPQLVKGLDLSDVEFEGVVRVHHGGDPMAQLMRLSWESFRRTLDAGDLADLDEEHMEALLRAAADPSFGFFDAASCAAWGRRRH